MRGVPMVSSEDSAWDVPPSIFGTRAGGPTVQRLVLGSQLHRLRESRGNYRRAGRRGHPRVALQDQPDGTWPGRLQGARRGRPADPLRRHRPEERGALLNLAREANTPGWWHAYSDILPDLAGALRGPGGGGVGHPDLPDPVRAGAAADRGLRPGADPPGLRGQRRRDRPPGRAAGQPPGDPAQARRPAAVGRRRRGRAAPPGRQPGDRPRAAAVPHRDGGSPGGDAADPVVRRGCALGYGRPVQHPAVRRAGPAGRRLHRAADQRALPGQAGRGGQLPGGHGAALPPGRAGGEHHQGAPADPLRHLGGGTLL